MAAVLFDLDGTLTDSGPGIMNSAAHALQSLGRPPLPAADLRRFVGPPLEDSFRLLAGLTGTDVDRAVHEYRAHFGQHGMYENRVYDGIPEVLSALRARGERLAVATSKATGLAVPILEHFGLADHFEIVAGAELDGSLRHKHEVIGACLNRLGLTCTANVVMVGDREHDGAGAGAWSLPYVGVLWGYGTREELVQAGAVELAVTPDVLLTAVDAARESAQRGVALPPAS